MGERGELFAGGADGDVAGFEVHDGDRACDGQVGALQPAAAAQGVHEGGSPRVGAVVDGMVEEFAAMTGDGGDGHTVVVDARVALPCPLGGLQDPGLVDVQDHAAVPGCWM